MKKQINLVTVSLDLHRLPGGGRPYLQTRFAIALESKYKTTMF